MLTEVCNMKFH